MIIARILLNEGGKEREMEEEEGWKVVCMR
jgi:hypothetical protein